MSIQTVNIQEAKLHLPRLLEQVSSGTDVIIAKKGKPVARISKIGEKKKLRFGVLKGKAKISDDFDAPLPDEFLSDFEGNECDY